MPKNWNRRFKHNRDKMKTGDIFELAEVVRNLSLRDHEKGLSTGEKQMFVKAKKILASELMYAKDMDEDEAAVWLDDVLSTVAQRQEEDREGRRGRERRSARRAAASCVRLGRSRRRRPRRAARRTDRPEGVRAGSGEPPLLAESLRAARGVRAGSTSIVVVAPPEWEEPVILLAEELGCGEGRRRRVAGRRDACRLRADRRRRGARRRGRDPRPRRRAAAGLRRGRRARCSTALNEGWDGAVPGLAARRTRSSASRRRARRRDAAPRRAASRCRRPQAFVAAVLRDALAGGGTRRPTARRSSRRGAAG